MEVGTRINNYLANHGITRTFLAKRTGLPVWKVTDICNGKRKNVDCIDYYKICAALGVPMETFIDISEA